jgi:eukaryotic-like serine/threonine-protein kinase
VHGADEILGWTGVWTDLLRGETLEQRLKRGVFGIDETRVVGIALCQALAAIHGDGLTHGDIKTANVMREDGGRIVLLDFGAARPAWLTELATGSISGSPLYMAPESLEGADPTPRADVYALGVTLYRLLTNAYPVEAVNMAELRAKHARGERVPLRDRRADLPSGLVEAIECALDPDPAKRAQSAGALERALHGPQKAGLSRWRLAAIAAGVVVIGAIAAIASTPFGPPGLSVEAALHRTADGATLGDGATIRAGDTLHLTLRASADVYLYVINEDSVGAVTRMYPLARVQPRNPLQGQRDWRVPARTDGRTMDWQVGPDGDVEHVLIVAARDELPDIDQRLVGVPQALEPNTALTLRGIDRLTPAPQREPGAVLTELERALSEKYGDRIWLRHLTLVKAPQ